MKYLIGIDIGTSGTKSVLFDTEGNTVASATADYPLYQPENGWAEQNPQDWWKAVCSTLSEISKKACGEICGIGLSGQMHGLVMLDEKNEVIRNAIIWCDGRTTEECNEIESIIGHDRLLEITGNPALEGFTASKIMWVKKHEPENFRRCRHILLPKDYIRYMLTGVAATDMALCGGGAKGSFWRSMIADIFNMPIKIMQSEEGPALGAAILAGCASGIFKNVPEGCEKLVKAKHEQQPNKTNHAEYEKYYEIYNSLYPSLKINFSMLADLANKRKD